MGKNPESYTFSKVPKFSLDPMLLIALSRNKKSHLKGSNNTNFEVTRQIEAGNVLKKAKKNRQERFDRKNVMKIEVKA